MSKPLPILSNMPWNVKQDIINELDHITRCSLRKCSKVLREIIDNSVVFHPILYIAVLCPNIVIGHVPKQCTKGEFMGYGIFYSKQDEERCVVTQMTGENAKEVNGDYIERAVSDLETSLKNPRSSIERFSIRVQRDKPINEDFAIFLTSLKNMLDQLPHQLNINRLALQFPATQEHVLHVLPYLKPGVLTHIQINNKREVDQLVNTEQWRMAESVVLENESNVRIQDLLHLQTFAIESYQLTREEMPIIIQAFLRHAKNLHYSIGLPQNYNLEPIETGLNGNETLDAGRCPNRWHMKIQGTEFHMEIVLTQTRLHVHRFLSSTLENT